MKTLSSYYLTNHQYIRYFSQKNNMLESNVYDQLNLLNTDAFGDKINHICNTYNINFSPYYLTLQQESPRIIDSFTSFFTTLLNKSDMSDYSDHVNNEGSNFNKVIDIMSHDVDYLLAGIACIQYFFL